MHTYKHHKHKSHKHTSTVPLYRTKYIPTYSASVFLFNHICMYVCMYVCGFRQFYGEHIQRSAYLTPEKASARAGADLVEE